MDISNSYQSNSNIPARSNAGGFLDYDLKNEKEEIEKITIEVKKELLVNWKKSYANAQIFPAQIAAMHPEVVDFLLSFNLVSVYDNIARQVNLDSKSRNILPKIVWQIAQTKNWDSLEQVLQAEMQLSSSDQSKVVELLQQNIANKIQALSEKPVVKKMVDENFVQKKQVQLSISEALAQYPRLAEQGITSNQLKLQYSPEPVRPSIKNWITDFHDGMGAGKHSPIDRGNFLFHSENGKRLTALDRQKLGAILKSLDEKTLLTVDAEAQIVLFQNNTDGPRIDNGLSTEMHGQVMPSNLDSRLRGNDNADTEVLQDLSRISGERTPRERRPDINLKQNQSLQGSYGRGAVLESTPATKDEIIQNKQLENKVQGFFAKTVDAERMQNVNGINTRDTEKAQNLDKKNAEMRNSDSPDSFYSGSAPSSALSGTFSQREKGEMKKTLQSNNFFSLPQSKPPIGSEHFDTQQPQNLNRINTENIVGSSNTTRSGNVLDSLPTHLPDRQAGQAGRGTPMDAMKATPKDEMQNVGSAPSSAHDYIGTFSQGEKGEMKKTLDGQNRDMMSDDALFALLQEKKISVGAVSFSSPQKLPAEQSANPIQVAAAQPQQPKQSPFHIGPSDYARDENVGPSKINKNIVDLKN